MHKKKKYNFLTTIYTYIDIYYSFRKKRQLNIFKITFHCFNEEQICIDLTVSIFFISLLKVVSQVLQRNDVFRDEKVDFLFRNTKNSGFRYRTQLTTFRKLIRKIGIARSTQIYLFFQMVSSDFKNTELSYFEMNSECQCILQ